jgi:crossover junction endodeoxyribonuclease RusA
MTSRKRETSPAEQQPAGLGREWTISLPYIKPTITMNEMSGKHWSQYLLAKRDLIKAGHYLARHHKIPMLNRITVELIFWPGNNTVHDADNIAPTLKALTDGLRRAGVIPDDRGRHVRSATCTVIELDDDPERRRDARLHLVVREV